MGQNGIRQIPWGNGDMYLDIARGRYSTAATEFKFGRNASLGVTEEVIWDGGGDYTFLDAAETMDVASTSIDDVNGGDGAWNIIIYGLDNDFKEITEVVLLNGTTPVTTQKSFRRTHRAFVIQSGNNLAIADSNLGDISITSSDTTTLQAKILTNNGQTLMAVYTVPANKTGYVTGISFNVGQGKQCLFKGKFRNGANDNYSFSTKYSLDVYQNTFFGDLQTPLRVPEKTDIVITGQMSSTPEATSSASFGLVLIDNV